MGFHTNHERKKIYLMDQSALALVLFAQRTRIPIPYEMQ